MTMRENTEKDTELKKKKNVILQHSCDNPL